MNIKTLGSPPLGAHWSYGSEHMCRIGKKDAAKMLAPFPLPKIGYETVAAGSRAVGELTVQNISGDYYAASVQWPINKWPAAFGEVAE